MRQIRKVISLLLLTTVVTLTTALGPCSQATVASALRDAAAGGQSILNTARSLYPATDPRLSRIEKYAELINRVATAYPDASPDQQVELLPLLTTAIGIFQSTILPMLSLGNPTIGVVLAGIDAALRIAANHFVKKEETIVKLARGTAAMPAIEDAQQKLRQFLQTPKVIAP